MYIALVINLSFITRIMLYQTLLVGTTFNTDLRFDILITLLSRSIDTIAFVNNNCIFLKVYSPFLMCS